MGRSWNERATVAGRATCLRGTCTPPKRLESQGFEDLSADPSAPLVSDKRSARSRRARPESEVASPPFGWLTRWVDGACTLVARRATGFSQGNCAAPTTTRHTKRRVGAGTLVLQPTSFVALRATCLTKTLGPTAGFACASTLVHEHKPGGACFAHSRGCEV